MKRDRISKGTRNAVARPLLFTQSVVERSRRLRKPSAKADAIGSAAGCALGAALLLAGVVQASIGKPAWAFGSLAAGAVTLASNAAHRLRMKKPPKDGADRD